MTAIFNKTPWPHLIIDDFLPIDIFQKLKTYVVTNFDLVTAKEHLIENHYNSSHSEWYTILTPTILELKDHYFDQLNFGNKRLPKKIYPYVQFNICPPGFKYPRIHQDSAQKIMTTVLYICPDQSNGTELYLTEHENSLTKIIEWIPNRSLSFVQQSKQHLQQTWHNYKNFGLMPRASVNLILSSVPPDDKY
jgi:hypothetical protein